MLLLSYYDDIAYLFNARVIHLLYFSAGLTGNMFMNVASLNFPNNLSTLGDLVMATDSPPSDAPPIGERLYMLQSKCKPNFSFSVPFRVGNVTFEQAYDFLQSSNRSYSVNIWYNSTRLHRAEDPVSLRVPRSVNMASNAYLKLLKGFGVKMQFDFVRGKVIFKKSKYVGNQPSKQGYIGNQIAFAFLVAANFSCVKSATVIGYIYVFASGLLGLYFFKDVITDASTSNSSKPIFQTQELKTSVEMQRSDVSQEREVVEQLLREPSTSYSIICDDLKKVYPGKDGNPDKFAVRGLSLALSRGECFGMLGPNGAGKTSLINMLIGFIRPTSGTAYIEGMDIRVDMNKIYTSIGVCPQHDLLWETLTGREHLLFYGRLKSLKGAALAEAVEESLKSVNLFYHGIADKQAGKYSGGMKRRLSVAISLIGDPQVVYMDEPSTGLDPASKKDLWKAVKQAKQDRAIILTTHSMEEAEELCDRVGIFVDGSLQCIGNTKEEEEIENLIRSLSPNVNTVYRIAGTQKFELPKQEVRISDVFGTMEYAKRRFSVLAWGLADTTLEDVFIKVAKDADAFTTPS
uniref:ABC transporter domain-containing protein n=1 Tax=Ananas comosus var. bracteatus TaxID=296719 RepID=A0A6V7QQH1_ANACO